MKLLQQNLIASKYIPFCTLSTNAIIRWKSLSVAWTWYCRRTLITIAPLEFGLTTWQPFTLHLTENVKTRDPVHFHAPRSSARISLRSFSAERSTTKQTLFSTETGWVRQMSFSSNIGSHSICAICSPAYPFLGCS